MTIDWQKVDEAVAKVDLRRLTAWSAEARLGRLITNEIQRQRVIRNTRTDAQPSHIT